jgi:uncharacterized membrane protein
MMGWLLLILGIALWFGAHSFKRLAPEPRARLGDKGKGLVAVLIVLGIVLMVIGYRATPFIPIWTPPTFMVHVNNLLMLFAIWLMSPAAKRGLILNKARHPMLGGFKLWALAHLLVNGDLASIVLFGGLLGWAVFSLISINRAEPDWQPGPAGTLAKDAIFLAASLVLLVVIGYIHAWLGVWPFPT